MLMKTVLLALALGYILCVVAKKQEGILKTLGYALGISTLVLALLYGLVVSSVYCPVMGKVGGMCGMKGGMMKAGHHQMMKR